MLLSLLRDALSGSLVLDRREFHPKQRILWRLPKLCGPQTLIVALTKSARTNRALEQLPRYPPANPLPHCWLVT